MLLWVGVLGGALAWSLHLLLSYLAVGLECGPGSPLSDAVVRLAGTVPLLHAVSALALTGALGSALAAGLVWRAAPAGSHRGRLALIGLVLDPLFALVIVIGATAPLFLPPC